MIHFIIPTDFSETAQNAQEYALELALLKQAKCTLVNAYEMPHDFAAEMENRVVVLRDRAKEKLKNHIDQLKKHPRYQKLEIGMLVEEGSPENVIPEIAEKEKADLIVIGLSKHGTFDEILNGNVGAEVLQRSQVPTLAIPKEHAFEAPREFVYAAEYREDDLQNLEELSQWAKLFDARLRVIHIEKKNTQANKMHFKSFNREVEERLSYPYVSQEMYIAEEVEKGIMEAVANNKGIILSMAHYHKSFLREIFGHSHTKAIAQEAKVPMLVFYEEE